MTNHPLDKVLMREGMARSRAEAQRLIKGGAVRVGGCSQSCSFFSTGACDCDGWQVVTEPTAAVPIGHAVKVGSGNWRLLKPRTDGKDGFDQVKGIGRA